MYSASTGLVTTAAATAETLLQLVASSTKRSRVRAVHCSCASSVATDGPARLRVLRQSTAGTSGGTVTPRDLAGVSTAVTVANVNYSAEPTAGDILLEVEFAVQGGGVDKIYLPGEEVFIPLSGRLGFEITTPNVQTTVELTVEFSED